MKIDTKQIFVKSSTTILLFVGIFMIFAGAQTVNAGIGDDGWCEAGNGSIDLFSRGSTDFDDADDNCLQETWNDIPQNVRDEEFGTGPQGFQNFEDTARGCIQDSRVFNGYDATAGSCANAIKYCYTRSMDASQCIENNAIQRLAVGCNDGKGTNDPPGCGPIIDINKSIVEAIDGPIENTITNSCTTSGGENEQAARDRCENLAQEVVEYCRGQQSGFDGSEYLLEDQSAYGECLRLETINRTDSGPECVARGGISIDEDTVDPVTGTNTVNKGCYAEHTDLINPEACKAGNGKWTKVDNATNDNHWECQDPNDVEQCDAYEDIKLRRACQAGLADVDCNQFATQEEKDACEQAKADEQSEGEVCLKKVGGKCVGIEPVTNECGQAKVNLVACGKDTGNVALNNILKIAVIILSIVVGIAAVGGLAWASILYSKAEDNEGNVSEAKTLIQNIVIGLLLYVLLVALINWLVPGGVF